MQRVEVVALRRPNEQEVEDQDVAPRKIRMQQVASAESDDRGQYRIFGLKPGEYYLRAEDTFRPQGAMVVDESFWLNRSLGSEYASVYYPGVTQVSQAQVTPIKAGEEVQVDTSMHRVKTVNVAGRVIGTGGPVANTMVHLEPADASDSDFDRGDTTDEKGSFLIRSVPEGTYYVIAFQRQENTPVFEPRARQKIEVMGENIDSLTISLNAGATILGRIKVDGASSVTLDRVGLVLTSVDEDGQMGGHGGVKKDGSFEIKSVHDGNYAVHMWGLDRNAYVKSLRSARGAERRWVARARHGRNAAWARCASGGRFGVARIVTLYNFAVKYFQMVSRRRGGRGRRMQLSECAATRIYQLSYEESAPCILLVLTSPPVVCLASGQGPYQTA